MDDFFKRTWARIDLDAVGYNFRQIRSRLKPATKVCCVVKADAYGHGAEALAREYEALGADYFAVSNLEEAVQLRNAGVTKPILILGYTPPCKAKCLHDQKITQAVLSRTYGEQLAQEAVQAGVTVRVHLKVDTGMSRIGFFFQEAQRDSASVDDMEAVCRLQGLQAEGIFTHFAVADEGTDGAEYTRRQFSCFTGAIAQLEARGIAFEIRHCANSAATLDYSEMQLDMVRPGIILYGLEPSEKMLHPISLHPVMELKSVISLLKQIEPETSVSYGRKFTANTQLRVATVPIGYADGYSRVLSQKASVLVHGRRAPILGRVCMDQLMLDVTGIPAIQEGDTVTLFGQDGGAFLPVDELANYMGTIHYEITCMLNKRVPRIYYRNDEVVGELNYICHSL